MLMGSTATLIGILTGITPVGDHGAAVTYAETQVQQAPATAYGWGSDELAVLDGAKDRGAFPAWKEWEITLRRMAGVPFYRQLSGATPADEALIEHELRNFRLAQQRLAERFTQAKKEGILQEKHETVLRVQLEIQLDYRWTLLAIGERLQQGLSSDAALALARLTDEGVRHTVISMHKSALADFRRPR